MISPPLDETRRRLLAEERRLLVELHARLVRLGEENTHAREVAEALLRLDEPFLLVVVGEFNSGKSAFVNALLGGRVLAEGVTPTTARLTLVRHADAVERPSRADGLEEVRASAEVLRGLSIVDTPGTNAVLRAHERLTREFVPRADIVLFVTSCDRPFAESERAFLEAIRAWGKQVVIVLNKVDLLASADEVARVVDYVREQARLTLAFEPEIFPLSARRALQARLANDAPAVESSGLRAFETHVSETLDETGRFRLKLESQLGIARRAREAAAALVAGRLSLLREDETTLESIDAQLEAHGADMGRDFRFRLADIETSLLDFEKRGEAFLDARLRLARFRELLDRSRLQRDFEREVVGNLPREIEGRMGSIVDWMVAEDLRQWQGVMRRLRARQAAHAERMTGRVEDRFEFDRAERLEAVGGEAQRAVDSYDAAVESERLARRVREALAGTALLQVSALGLGALVAALASTTVADVTGILAAGALSVVGFLILPARRRRARSELRERVASLRRRLVETLSASFERERDRSRQRVREAIGPYDRFVRTESERLCEAREALAALQESIAAQAARVEAMAP